MRARALRAALAAAALAAAPAAFACGICVEDKVAATYDYDVVTRATARHHVVVFAAVDDPRATAAPRALREAAARVRGVDRASVRSAAAPRALSFALDPRAGTPRAALRSIERQPAMAGVRLTLIRVMR